MHDGAPHNAQYHVLDSDDISNAHVSGNEIGCGKGGGAKGTITLASLSFSKALVKVVPNGVNCLTGLYAHGLGGGGVVAFRYGGHGCIVV